MLLQRLLCFVAAVTSTSLFAAAAPKSYQVTGNVTEVTDTKIVVQKGNEKWDLARDSQTKQTGDAPKVGDKVTVQYQMEALGIATKPAAAAKK